MLSQELETSRKQEICWNLSLPPCLTAKYYMTKEELAILVIRIKMTIWVSRVQDCNPAKLLLLPIPHICNSICSLIVSTKWKKWGNFPFLHLSVGLLPNYLPATPYLQQVKPTLIRHEPLPCYFWWKEEKDFFKLQRGGVIAEGTLGNCCQLCRTWLSKRKTSSWNMLCRWALLPFPHQ